MFVAFLVECAIARVGRGEASGCYGLLKGLVNAHLRSASVGGYGASRLVMRFSMS